MDIQLFSLYFSFELVNASGPVWTESPCHSYVEFPLNNNKAEKDVHVLKKKKIRRYSL